MISCSVLMCHAPIVIPEIGGSRASECQKSTLAMKKAAQKISEKNPETLIVLSPHTPRLPNHFGLMDGNILEGSFGPFGFPQLQCEFSSSLSLQADLLTEAKKSRLPLQKTPSASLDHGALVPLYFLSQTKWTGEILLISFPYEPQGSELETLGEFLEQKSQSRNWAILASGDMSHRLTPDAPAGFHPQAKEFDQFVTDSIREGNTQRAVSVDPELRELAAEDVIDSLQIAGSAVQYQSKGFEFLSYEGPFGVGYLVSVLYDEGHESITQSRTPSH